MKAIPLAVPEVFLIEPTVHEDERGFFFESFNQRGFESAIGRKVNFVQENHSLSLKNVLRGLHYQIQHPQGKLIRVLAGEIFDVCVDLRKTSPAFGKWAGCRLSGVNRQQLWIPEGFAHGYLVLSSTAEVLYKTTDYWAVEFERSILWNDPELGIDWPFVSAPILSQKDRLAKRFSDAEVYQ